METTEIMERNLGSIERGAVAFKVLGVVFIALGCLKILAAGASLTIMLGPDGTWAEAGSAFVDRASGTLTYFLWAWLAGRAHDAFEAVAALVREMREIV